MEAKKVKSGRGTGGKGRSLSGWVRRFLEYCEVERGHSPLTIQNYAHYLARLLEYCQDRYTSPADLDLEVIHNYRLWLNRLPVNPNAVKQPNTSPTDVLSKTTQNYHLIALRSFLKYLTKQDVPCLPPDRIELADTPEREIVFMEIDELARLLAAPDSTNLLGARDQAILALLFSTGLRVAELTALDRRQVNLKTDELTVVGKGGKARLVFISPDARDALGNYLKRRKDRDEALFVRHGKKATSGKSAGKELRLTPRTIQRIVKKYALKAGLTKDIHPHTLRHSFATDLLDNGADIRSVQQLLGHSSITTTQMYTHVTDKKLREIHRRYHGKKTN